MGKNVPTFYKNKVDIDEISGWYLEAWSRLRENITMVELKAYIDLFKIHRPVNEFVDCILALDREVKKANQKKATPSPKLNSNSPNQVPRINAPK